MELTETVDEPKVTLTGCVPNICVLTVPLTTTVGFRNEFRAPALRKYVIGRKIATAIMNPIANLDAVRI